MIRTLFLFLLTIGLGYVYITLSFDIQSKPKKKNGILGTPTITVVHTKEGGTATTTVSGTTIVYDTTLATPTAVRISTSTSDTELAVKIQVSQEIKDIFAIPKKHTQATSSTSTYAGITDIAYDLYTQTEGSSEKDFLGTVPQISRLPGNNLIYTKSRVNELFPTARTFVVKQNNEVVEVHQPLLYVGVSTIVREDIQISGNLADDIVVTIEAGSPVEVLALENDTVYTDKNRYLIRTQNGVLGWIKKIHVKDMIPCDFKDGQFVSDKTTFKHICLVQN